MNNLRVIIAGGGTGGHIFPAIAIGKALQRLQPGTELLFVGANGRMEMEKVPQEGFKIIGLDIAGFDRSNLLNNLSLPFKMLKSRMKAKEILNDFKANVVVGVGGYASYPMLSAAQSLSIPTLIQEQNSFAGKANKMLSKKAAAVCVAYEHMGKFFPKEKLILTGNPVRKEITGMSNNAIPQAETFGLVNGTQTVLIVGGSLGAKAINESIDAGLDTLMKNNVQVIWQTGKPYYQQALKRAEPYKGRVAVMEFIKDMATAYTLADVVISRAGALAIAELCIAGKPAIFVPLPTAAEDHQTSNAMALVNQKAAMMIKNELAVTELIPAVVALLADERRKNEMSENLRALAIKDADERIAHKIIAIAKN